MDTKILYRYQVQVAVLKYKQDYYMYNQQISRRKLLAIIVALSNIIEKKKKHKRKRFWISELCQNRQDFGAFYNVYPIILNNPTITFLLSRSLGSARRSQGSRKDETPIYIC